MRTRKKDWLVHLTALCLHLLDIGVMSLFFFSFLFFLGLHPWHIEVSRLGVEVESELELLADTTDIATPDQSPVCNLHRMQQHQTFNQLSKARD